MAAQVNGDGPQLAAAGLRTAAFDRRWASVRGPIRNVDGIYATPKGGVPRDGIHAPWPAPGPYFNRPDLLIAQGCWPRLAAQQGPGHQTRFHLRQTKAIDQPAHACVIETNAARTADRNSTRSDEAMHVANGAGRGFVIGGAVVGPYETWRLAAAALPVRTARSMPSFLNPSMNLYIHIRVRTAGNVAVPAPVGSVPTEVAAASAADIVAGGDGRQLIEDYRLRQCWYAVLDEGMTACAVPVGIGAAWQMANGIAAATLNAPNSTTIPLLGMTQGYGSDRAAEQACMALKEWFHPTFGSESSAVAATAAAVTTLQNNRRAHYSDIYLTIPNGTNNLNPAVPGITAHNVFGRVMRGQEHDWTKAFLYYLRCGQCGNGID